MKSREQIELEKMALVAELSRQLAHDFNNFIYNFVLQIEIWERLKSERVDWETMKLEAKKMTGLLHEWDRLHNRTTTEEPVKIELRQLLRQVVADRSPNPLIHVEPCISGDPLWISGEPLAMRHLFVLLLEDAALAGQVPTGAPLALSIQSDKTDNQAVVRIIRQVESTDAQSRTVIGDANHQAQPKSLLTSTCDSLAQRLDANIRREHSAAGLTMIVIEVPL